MKKILLSILAIALTVGTVSASAYALFSDTASVAGVTITSGNADLQIALDNTGDNFSDNALVPADIKNVNGDPWLKNFYPGMEDWGYFRLKNNSKSKISLKTKGTITSATTWDLDLANSVQLMISDDNHNTIVGWHTLEEWNQNIYSFNDVLAFNQAKTYRVYVRLLSSATNTVANMQLKNINLEFTAEQQ